MNRREMLKKTSMCAVAPLVFPCNVLMSSDTTRQSGFADTLKRFGDERDWFFEKKYGMFVHFGLYSIPGWHEQLQWRGRIPRSEYVKLADKWNPAAFDPNQWLDLMQEAGLEYITFTAKHHDGFCLWDSAQTTFNSMHTPYKQDFLGKLADACHKRDVPLCIYYSIADWHHPNYPNQGRHHELPGPEPGDHPDWDAYMEFLKAQVRELCTNYGRISGFWWDMNVPGHKDAAINGMIRKLQPSAVINNRGFDEGDFGTPERDDSYVLKAIERPTEACQSVGMFSWGYKKDEDFYSDVHLKRSIDKYLSRGANFLINVGPNGEGVITDAYANVLRRLGKWYKAVKESYSNTVYSPEYISSNEVSVTKRDNTVYLHFYKGIKGSGLSLKPLKTKPVGAVLLNTGEPVETVVNLSPADHAAQISYLRLHNLPVNDLQNDVPVVKLEFS